MDQTEQGADVQKIAVETPGQASLAEEAEAKSNLRSDIELIRKKIERGDRLLLCGFGVGYSMAASIIEY